MSTPISGMAVTVTLLFADEAHREAWLVAQGVIDAGPLPPKNAAGEYLIDEVAPERGAKRSAILRRLASTPSAHSTAASPRRTTATARARS